MAGDSLGEAALSGSPGVSTDQDVPTSRAEQLFQRTYRDIYAYCLRRSASVEDAQDAAAEVFSTAWKRIDQVPLPPEDRLWLFGVARRVVSRHHRGAQRRSALVGKLTQEPIPIGSHEQSDLVETVRLAISQLPERDREALQLVMWDQLTHEEAATVLGCSRAALDVRLHRARKRLELVLGELQRPTIELEGGASDGT